MNLLLALAYTSDQALRQVLAAGAMPVIISMITAYADAVKRGSALQLDADTEPGEASAGPSSANLDTFTFVPTPTAVLTALFLCQVRLIPRQSVLVCHGFSVCDESLACVFVAPGVCVRSCVSSF